MELIYRKAKSTDAPRIADLFLEMLRTIYDTDDVKGYEEGYLDRFFSAEREDLIYVAEADGKVVAYLSVEVHRSESYIYLDDLSVTSAYRGQGIGSKLIKMAEEYAGKIGIIPVVFHVEKSNIRAHQLYKRLGYQDNEDQGSRMRMAKELRKVK